MLFDIFQRDLQQLAFRVEKLDFAVGPPPKDTGVALAVTGNHDLGGVIGVDACTRIENRLN